MTLLTLSSPASAPARFATSRDPRSATYGPAVGMVAAALGWPLLPWQQQVADVACEMDDDGRWRYPTVVITVPRQSGKTTLIGAVLAHRTLTMPDHRSWYTAQTGQNARDTWREWQARLSRSMPRRWRFRMSNGAETATWPATGSFIRSFPPTEESLHGVQSDTTILDEVWSLTPERGEQLLQAVVPTQATRPRRQLWIVSTAGSDESVWFRSWVDRGRSNPPGVAYFEWSAPDDVDPDDEQSWPSFHPGYPALIDDQAMHAALAQFGPDGFSRGYMNRWPVAGDGSFKAAWPTCRDDDARIPAAARVSIGVDAAVDGKSAAIVAAATLPDGRIALEVIDHRPGLDWLVPRCQELTARHSCSVAMQRVGPAGHLIIDLERARVKVRDCGSIDFAGAVSRLRQLVTLQRVTHTGQEPLDLAVESAVTRQIGDRDVFWRRGSVQDISPLTAATLAVWAESDTPPTAAIHVARPAMSRIS